MKHLAAVCTPIHAAAVEGRVTPHDAIEAAYRHGHAPKEGMTSDDIVAEVSAPDRMSVSKVEYHCKPLQKLHDEGRITLEKAIEASYKLGVEEKGYRDAELEKKMNAVEPVEPVEDESDEIESEPEDVEPVEEPEAPKPKKRSKKANA